MGWPLATKCTLTDPCILLRARPPVGDGCTCPPPVHMLPGTQTGGSPVPPRWASPKSRWWQAAGLKTKSGVTLPHGQARGACGQQQLDTWIPNRKLVGGCHGGLIDALTQGPSEFPESSQQGRNSSWSRQGRTWAFLYRASQVPIRQPPSRAQVKEYCRRNSGRLGLRLHLEHC